MKVKKALITAAGKGQHNLPLQTLIDRDGVEKAVLRIIVEEALCGGVEEIGVLVPPGDVSPYEEVVKEHIGHLTFIHQNEPLGYGHAIYCARDFVGSDPFLHMVGDHLHIGRKSKSCAEELIGIAESEKAAVSAVQATRENLLPYFGTIGGKRVQGKKNLYEVDRVIEKPTPTQAEQDLIIPGMRAGYYLCFFGMHVLTSTVIDILGRLLSEASDPKTVTLSDALNELAQQEKLLALGKSDQRYDIGVKYGLLTAQIALAMSGKDRDEVLTKLLELLYIREQNAGRHEE